MKSEEPTKARTNRERFGLLWELRRNAVLDALTRTQDTTQAAALLGMTRNGLLMMRNRWKIMDWEWKREAPPRTGQRSEVRGQRAEVGGTGRMWLTKVGLIWAELVPGLTPTPTE